MSPISDELAVLRSRPTLDHLVMMVAHTDVPQRRCALPPAVSCGRDAGAAGDTETVAARSL